MVEGLDGVLYRLTQKTEQAFVEIIDLPTELGQPRQPTEDGKLPFGALSPPSNRPCLGASYIMANGLSIHVRLLRREALVESEGRVGRQGDSPQFESEPHEGTPDLVLEAQLLLHERNRPDLP